MIADYTGSGLADIALREIIEGKFDWKILDSLPGESESAT